MLRDSGIRLSMRVALTSCAFSLFMKHSAADRVSITSSSGEDPKLKGLLANSPEAICGGEEIWRMIQAGPSVKSVENINWAKIEAVANDYITVQRNKVDKLEVEIEQLSRRIEHKQKEESWKDATAEQIRGLITKGLEGGFGDVENAQRTLCGVPRIRPRAQRHAFSNTCKAFDEAATAFFNGEVVLSGDTFKEVCDEMLPCGEAEDCYCPELCQRLRDEAQELSDASPGARAGGSGSDELLREQKSKMNDMAYHKTERSQCEQDKETISTYSKQVLEMKADIKEKFASVMDAEAALDDALYSLAELEDALEQQENATAEAVKAVEEAGNELADAKQAFAEAQLLEEDLKNRSYQTKKSLAHVRVELERAKMVDSVVAELKLAVTGTLLKMQLFFEEAVQEPLRNLGLAEDVNVPDFFQEPAELNAAKGVHEQVRSLHGFCAEDAKKAFDTVADTIDLSPLCDFQEPGAVSSDLDGTLVKRSQAAKDQLEHVKSWLDPFKGQPELTEEMRQEFLDAGEPEGLREVVGVYSQSKFYQYLRGWKAGGMYLQLIAKLKETIDDLDKSVAQTREDLANLKEEMGRAMEQRQEVNEKLENATRAHAGAIGHKEEMERKVAELQEQGMKMQASVDELRRQLEEARRAWEAARERLLKSHAEAISLLQFLPAEGGEAGGSLEELRVQAAAAKLRARGLELALEGARRSESRSAKRLAAARHAEAERLQGPAVARSIHRA